MNKQWFTMTDNTMSIVLSVIVNHCLFFWYYSFDHYVVYHCKSLFVLLILFFWPLCFGQQNKIKWRNNDLQWQTINTMSKGIRSKEQTMIYNDRQYKSVIVNHCLFFWSHSFDHCVVCHCKSWFVLLILFFWPLCCLSL
jgi:hypothetical protein